MLRPIRLLTLGVTLGLLVVSGPLQAQDKSSLPLPENLFPDLKRILESAVRQSPRMIGRNVENAIAEQNRLIARSGQLPTAGGYMSYYPYARDDRADLSGAMNVKKFNYAFNIVQPIYHWGALESNTRIGELGKKITEGQTADAYRMLIQEIRSLYLSVVVKKMIVSRSQLNLGVAQDQLALAESKFEKKVIAESDMFSPRLNHDQAVLNVDRNTEDYESAKATLAKLSGTPVLSDNQIPTDVPNITVSPEPLNSYLTKFTSEKEPKTFYLENLRNQIEIEKLNYKIADARLKPKLNAVVGASQDEQSYTSNIAAKYKVQSTYAGVSVSWSIFDGFAARSTKAATLARQHQAERTYEDAVANLSDQARSALKQLGFSARSMELANRIQSATEGYYHSRQDDVKRGLASESDVNAARISFFDAQLGATNARFDYMLKTGDFLSMILEDPALENLPGHTP